jgi:hypothetical protein
MKYIHALRRDYPFFTGPSQPDGAIVTIVVGQRQRGHIANISDGGVVNIVMCC